MNALREYIEKVLGSNRLELRFLTLYELYSTFVLQLPGALGVALRMIWLRFILSSVGRRPIVFHSVILRGVRNIIVGNNVMIESTSLLDASGSRTGIVLGDNVEIHRGVGLYSGQGSDAGIMIGRNSKVGPNVSIYGNGRVEIGDSVLIAANTVITSSSHNIENLAVAIGDQGLSTSPITIESNVWIGANCTILKGVKIGSGSVIGSNSLVNKDVPANSIAYGQPAIVHRSRES